MQNLSPSPALSVPSDTTIRETLRIMREHNVGSVLVNNYQYPYNLMGIFTERDLLKWVGEIEKHNSWDTSIATIMTKKIISLPIMEIHRAGEVMIANNFRHMPIIYESERGINHVAGVVSMRDVLKAMVVEKKEREVREKYKDKRTFVLAYGSTERKTQSKLLDDFVDLQIIEKDFSAGATADDVTPLILTGDVFIFDLDHFAPAFWSQVLKKVVDTAVRPEVFVVYDPIMQGNTNVQILRQLSKAPRIHVFAKPINLLEYLRQIEKALKT